MSYIGNRPSFGNFIELDNIAGSFNGVTTVFDLTNSGTPVIIGSINTLLLFINNIPQNQGQQFTLGPGSSQISFITPPTGGQTFLGYKYGDITNVNVPADLSVTTGKLNDSAVTAGKIASNAVTETKIIDSAVTANKLASNAVTSVKINDSAVTTTKINNGAVTASKMGSESASVGYGARADGAGNIVYAPIDIPQVISSADRPFVLTDNGKHILHPAADTTARTWTIPANASVAFPIGAAITLVNEGSAGSLTIAITSDTLVWIPSGTTGSRTLAANGQAVLFKITATKWHITGVGLT